ncbi:hypothetical protein [Paenarthrobacter nitroguajacolicus]|uniref:hypothetical protein n=1 Tax=Paenarthrobacter nitroguajacolicus TaxID=211146 RepID=UPI0015BE4234|nr:hypothetical protein [Paenarthrobacter nitroguajacolicus]NWL34474.1 hypothetical protein [Paenarthrobacter nitroguajacolicus]
MPSNTDYLHKLAHYNKQHGITATFSEMKKTARRIERICKENEEARNAVDPLAYVLQHWDPTGEEASENVDAERHLLNQANAARRCAGPTQRKAATMPGDRLQQNPYQGELQ